ncbi:MAG: electron transfer flavoprotein subunit alpha/FixB family protein [Peptococcaceae bacterium]|nr:electron transfer flavoprotein subunit alpha/FixB family protein [Peptococcaceae bacterium]
MDGKNGLWVIVERSANGFRKVALELLSRGRDLAGRLGEVSGSRPGVWAVVTGPGSAPGTEELYRYGADEVLMVCHPLLEEHRTDLHAAVLADLIRERSPGIVLFGATAWGSEVAPTVAARVKTGLAAHCADLRIDGRGLLVQCVPAFGGKVLGEILCPDRRPQMASVRPGVFQAVPGDAPAGEPLVVRPELDDDDRIKVLEVQRREITGKPLEEAEVVIAGGWGVGSRENWQLLEELAGLLGAAVGCTRPALDEGWTEGEHTMIGTSGKTVRPKVYLGFGISGATHHVVGMKDSGLVISVNTNPNAEIFQFSDFKVVADARAVAEALIAELKAGKTS